VRTRQIVVKEVPQVVHVERTVVTEQAVQVTKVVVNEAPVYLDRVVTTEVVVLLTRRRRLPTLVFA